jgi:serine phosphatase RsbU (regulator of sigma subunit)
VHPSYEIYGVNHSCYQIGGDYYDFIDKANGKMAIVIADVSGKGVGAALLMAAFQASIRTLVKSEDNPASLVAHLNNVMFENSPPNKYITVFYGEIDTLNHTFEYVNAGHNPAIYMTENGYQLLEACGPVVGIIANAHYKSQQIPLNLKDILFLYTDGITEAVDPEDKEFGEDGVLQVLTANRTATVEDLAQTLERQIREFTRGAPPLDDSTLIFVRRIQ